MGDNGCRTAKSNHYSYCDPGKTTDQEVGTV